MRGNISKVDNANFHFEHTSLDQTLKELEKLDPKKASQVNDIPVKVITENKDIAGFFTHHNFKNSLSSSTFSTVLKYADVKPIFKDKTGKENYRLIIILPTLKNLKITKCICTLINFFQDSNMVFEKVLILNTA